MDVERRSCSKAVLMKKGLLTLEIAVRVGPSLDRKLMLLLGTSICRMSGAPQL